MHAHAEHTKHAHTAEHMEHTHSTAHRNTHTQQSTWNTHTQQSTPNTHTSAQTPAHPPEHTGKHTLTHLFASTHPELEPTRQAEHRLFPRLDPWMRCLPPGRRTCYLRTAAQVTSQSQHGATGCEWPMWQHTVDILESKAIDTKGFVRLSWGVS